MDGQARKLGLRPGHRVALDHPPAGWALDERPEGAVVVGPRARADVTVAFVSSAAQLARRLPGLVARLAPESSLWLAWPRRAGGHQSDLTDNVVRTAALDRGLVDTKVCALDDDWSALQFVWPRASRGAVAGRAGRP